MQSEYKEKQQDAKGKLQSDMYIYVHFANLLSKEHFSIQRLIIFLVYE